MCVCVCVYVWVYVCVTSAALTGTQTVTWSVSPYKSWANFSVWLTLYPWRPTAGLCSSVSTIDAWAATVLPLPPRRVFRLLSRGIVGLLHCTRIIPGCLNIALLPGSRGRPIMRAHLSMWHATSLGFPGDNTSTVTETICVDNSGIGYNYYDFISLHEKWWPKLYICIYVNKVSIKQVSLCDREV